MPLADLGERRRTAASRVSWALPARGTVRSAPTATSIACSSARCARGEQRSVCCRRPTRRVPSTSSAVRSSSVDAGAVGRAALERGLQPCEEVGERLAQTARGREPREVGVRRGSVGRRGDRRFGLVGGNQGRGNLDELRRLGDDRRGREGVGGHEHVPLRARLGDGEPHEQSCALAGLDRGAQAERQLAGIATRAARRPGTSAPHHAHRSRLRRRSGSPRAAPIRARRRGLRHRSRRRSLRRAPPSPIHRHPRRRSRSRAHRLRPPVGAASSPPRPPPCSRSTTRLRPTVRRRRRCDHCRFPARARARATPPRRAADPRRAIPEARDRCLRRGERVHPRDPPRR